MTPPPIVDLASRALGAGVVWADDESFAEKENLLTPAAPVFDPLRYGHKGKVYDGWETRRRRQPGHDAAVVRLAAPGVVRRVVVDTAHFLGNYPPEVSVEGACLGGHPGVEDLHAASWRPLVPRSGATGGSQNTYDVSDQRRVTHVRLSIYPDGGVARLRVHGEVLPDPLLVEAMGTVDLAAAELGGTVTACSDGFYGSPQSLLMPGLARSMGEGWETARRRDGGNDWVEVRLGVPGRVRVVEVDTSYYVHNAPGSCALTAAGRAAGGDGEVPARPVLLPPTPLRPDTRHRFVVAAEEPVRTVRLDVHPDGGVARLRLWGTPSAEGLAQLHERWRETTP